MNILILEDNESIREAVASFLSLEDYSVKSCGTVKEAKYVNPESVDLYILDVMLPDGNGFLYAKEIREVSTAPIIFLTAKSSESERIKGFELGGDDYITKPFSLQELTLRVKAILKRSRPPIRAGNLMAYNLGKSSLLIDKEKHLVSLDKKEIQLTQTEWLILLYLVENRMVLSKERILENCLGYSSDSSDRVVITHIKNIREKLGELNWIETVRGFGYKFQGEE